MIRTIRALVSRRQLWWWLLVMVGCVAVTRFARAPSSPVMWQQWAHVSQFHLRLTAPLVAAVVAYRASTSWLRPTRLVAGVAPRRGIGKYGVVFAAEVAPPIVGLAGALAVASVEFWMRATHGGPNLVAALVGCVFLALAGGFGFLGGVVSRTALSAPVAALLVWSLLLIWPESAEGRWAPFPEGLPATFVTYPTLSGLSRSLLFIAVTWMLVALAAGNLAANARWRSVARHTSAAGVTAGLAAMLVAFGPPSWTVTELSSDELTCEVGPPMVCLAPSWAAIAPEVRSAATAATALFWSDLGRPFDVIHVAPTSDLARDFARTGGLRYPLVSDPAPGAGFEPAVFATVMAVRLSGLTECGEAGVGSEFRRDVARTMVEIAGFHPSGLSDRSVPEMTRAEVAAFLDRSWTTDGLDCLAR